MSFIALCSCGHDDEPVQPDEIQTAEITFYNRTISGGNVVFLQSTGMVEVNYTQETIQISCDYNDASNQRHRLNTPKMKLYYEYGNTLSFVDTTYLSSVYFSRPHGLIDMETGVIWYEYAEGYEKTVFTTYLNYNPFTEIMNIEDGHFLHNDKTSYLFAPNDKGTRCIMQINNFVPDTTGTPLTDFIQFQGLTMSPTVEGYKITADRTESIYGSPCTITDVDIVISGQCRDINGTFKCNGYKFRIAGPLFGGN